MVSDQTTIQNNKKKRKKNSISVLSRMLLVSKFGICLQIAMSFLNF